MGEARASTGRGAGRARVSLVCVCQLEHPQLSTPRRRHRRTRWAVRRRIRRESDFCLVVDRYRQAEVARYTGSRTIGQHGGYRKTATIMDGERPLPDTEQEGMVYLYYMTGHMITRDVQKVPGSSQSVRKQTERNVTKHNCELLQFIYFRKAEVLKMYYHSWQHHWLLGPLLPV